MGKKVVVISSTMRINGNSEILCKEFAKGAKDSGNDVVTIYLREHEINYCKGCWGSQKVRKCVIDDGVNPLLETIKNADVLVFGTPIYYYSITGQLKTFLDRLTPIYDSNHKFRDVYLLATAADMEIEAMDGAIREIEGWISCFEDVKLKGIVCATGASDIGDIKKNPEKIKEVYTIGKNIK